MIGLTLDFEIMQNLDSHLHQKFSNRLNYLPTYKYGLQASKFK